ncbi:HD domain-containing protein [Prosthecochloris sp. SCSIO W1101]|uniref:HD domain-containing protein n=1 Tax=Prosthecochloris sp. SCSIO W1101 TaxID=2992242 RepID=UPI00223CB79A|nr:HD domain-containing protein [Prosthecochloris sp. SCSIO W1101]UZJ40618.1 HD domain-containing protein [Prosthecochloris sp. SCSIO W1101]
MNNNLSKDFKDIETIMDSIYGIVKISPFEKRIISTKEMQRLRGIKQLGFVNLVYPDAEHSRFSHSIGVCHQAKIIIDHISKNIIETERYREWRNIFSKDKNIESPKIFGITDIEKIVISAAALLHDLPHAPFSHEIENPKKDGSGIPVHDKYQNNPTFFLYLFDKDKSDLAKVIEIYNKDFWKLVKKDNKWGKALESNKDICENGFIEKDIFDAQINENDKSKSNKKLPLLGVMIFELMLFDKMELWLDINSEKSHVEPRKEGIKIPINDTDIIIWKPIENWFRPYRKDIVANTICADLLDYLVRDGKNTGIIPSLDLKFLDRMTIAKAIPDQTNTLIPLKEIPDFCEHVVFDIYDHKRGAIRLSIITEIISLLQQRYLLAERVYNHRVVEGARSMLQETSNLLISAKAIDSKELHNTNSDRSSPIGDDSLLSWILDINHNDKKEIIKAKQLVKMIRERRIFREVVIIDGVVGLHKGSYRGSAVNCKTLADSLLIDDKRNKIIKTLNEKLINYCNNKEIYNYPNPDIETLFTIGVRKFGKRYKVPRVLVAKPITHNKKNDIEIFPLFDGKELPAIKDRLSSMQDAYNSLWKVYLFIHPFFHQKGAEIKKQKGEFKFVELHKIISTTFIDELYTLTGIKWTNSIENYDDLLMEIDFDISSFVSKATESEYDEKIEYILFIQNMINESLSPEHKIYAIKGKSMEKSFEIKLLALLDDNFFQNKALKEIVIHELRSFNPNHILHDERLIAADHKDDFLITVVENEIKNITTAHSAFIIELIEIIDEGIPEKSNEFRLTQEYSKQFTKKLKKHDICAIIFEDNELQRKTLTEVRKLKFNFDSKARNKKDSIANQVISLIEKIIKNEPDLFTKRMVD